MSVAGARRKASSRGESRGRLPKVVVPVHFAGQSCEMREIRALADRYGFRIIEDASHAVGGEYLRPQGRLLATTATSPFQLSPGQDHHHRRRRHGADQRRAARRAPLLSAHARHHPRQRPENRRHVTERRRAGQRGTRWPVDIRADRARAELPHDRHSGGAWASQLARLDRFVARRRELAARYDELLAETAADTPVAAPDTNSALAPLCRFACTARDQASRRQVFDALRAPASASTCTTFRCTCSPITGSSVSRPACSRRPRAYYAGRDHAAAVLDA